MCPCGGRAPHMLWTWPPLHGPGSRSCFYGKYFPADVRGRQTREFMSLRQRDSSVTEFIRKFDRGCHFVPMIAGNAGQKLRHFMDGLRPSLHRDVMFMRPASYDEATACAFQLEQSLRDIDFEMQQKRHQTQSSSHPQKKQFSGPPRQQGQQKPQGQFRRPQLQRPTQAPGAPKPEDRQTCPQCVKFHIGRIYIAGVATHALLDSGAMHSFISETFVKRLGIIPFETDSWFGVSIPSKDQMFTSRIVRRLELRLQPKAVQADLIVLPLPEFDIILGMDWLSSHGAVIDFHQRSVSVRPPSGKPFVFEAARHQQFPHVISCMCARKLIKRGCHAFLASIVSMIEPVNQMWEDVDVVSEFSSVFPDDVSGIPPDREVDFSIELMPGTVSISKAPYRL
ncbi:uncharacterized protein [Primulina eburnea]|uniref:uncharacterized protein n=1 Tax=Primulina eburnea TaxID=1245227 RepID=UPI003C6C4504